MKHVTIIALFIITSASAFSQSKFSKQEISINGFRNPSIGAEYRYQHISVHAGYYPTAFKAGENTNFFKAGISLWFLPVGKKNHPSSFYGSLSYARGLSRDYKNKNAGIAEVGFRWMVWKGINLRLGVAALTAKGETLKINPTPGIGYAFFF